MVPGTMCVALRSALCRLLLAKTLLAFSIVPIIVTLFASNSQIKTSVTQLGAWHHIVGRRQLLAFSQSP